MPKPLDGMPVVQAVVKLVAVQVDDLKYFQVVPCLVVVTGANKESVQFKAGDVEFKSIEAFVSSEVSWQKERMRP